jgi:hypothetical protein
VPSGAADISGRPFRDLAAEEARETVQRRRWPSIARERGAGYGVQRVEHGDPEREPDGDREQREPDGDRERREPHGDREQREPHGDREQREPDGDAGRCDAGRGVPSRSPRSVASRSPRCDGPPTTVTGATDLVDQLASCVDGVVARDLDGLADGDLRAWLRDVQRQLDRLSAARAAAAGELQRRAVRDAGPGREARAERDTRRFLVEELRLSPSEAKRTGDTGRRLQRTPSAARAFAEGQLGADHAKVITDTVKGLAPDVADQLEEELTRLAATMDPVALARRAHARLAELDQAAAVRTEQARHAQRFARVTQTSDGMVRISAALAGLDGEAAMTALHAYTRHEGADHPGTREQRAADALAEIFRQALQAGEAPTVHGVRPQVHITVAAADLASGTGAGWLEWTGAVSVSELRRWLRDAQVSAVVLDDDGVPLAVTDARPAVPAALWRALRLRDGGCRFPGCDRPPSWCDVAHALANRRRGPTKLQNLALLCRRHHRQVDLGGWTMAVDGTTVTFTHRDGRELVDTRGDPPP